MIPCGNFFFGDIQTNVDVFLWDVVDGIELDNIQFQLYTDKISFYDKIDRVNCNIQYEKQNNTIISLVNIDHYLSDNDEKKIVSIQYQDVEYKLFFKTLHLWDNKMLGISQKVLEYKIQNVDAVPYVIPNAMGMSFFVITKDNKIIFSQRSVKRKIRSEEYDSTIVEGLKIKGKTSQRNSYDIYSKDYLKNECLRAYREELCSDDSNLIVKINGIVLDKEYGQWNFIGTIFSSYTEDEIARHYVEREDSFESNRLFFVSLRDAANEKTLKNIDAFLRYIHSHSRIWSMAIVNLVATLKTYGFQSKEIDQMAHSLNIVSSQNNKSIKEIEYESVNQVCFNVIIDKLIEVQKELAEINKKQDKEIEMLEKMTFFITKSLPNQIAAERELLKKLEQNEDTISEWNRKLDGYICYNIKQYGETNEITNAQNELRSVFDKVWYRLDNEVRTSLVSSRVMWLKCKEFSGSFDYSGVCITATAALESLLTKVFLKNFQDYLNNKNIPFWNWPSTLVYNDHGTLTPNKYFTLGNLKYLLGDSDEWSDETKWTKNRKMSLDNYLNSIIKKEENCNNPRDVFIKKKYNGKSFLERCEDIRIKYRNEAAHTNCVDKQTAEQCYDEIIGVREHLENINNIILILFDILKSN